MSKDYWGYKGKICIVTGAASGMGKATAEMLVDLGAEVYALDRAAIEVAGVKKKIIVNLAEKESIDKAFKQIPNTIDRFFGIAGVSGVHNSFAETLTINYVANKYITEEYMEKRMPNGGGIVYTTSCAGLGWEFTANREEFISVIGHVGWEATVAAVKALAKGKDNVPADAVYGLSKRIMNYYIATIQEKFGEKKIRVNAILPMGTDTGLTEDFGIMAGSVEIFAEYGTGLAHRLARPQEMAAPMVFLNSDMASFLGGLLLNADSSTKIMMERDVEPNVLYTQLLGKR